MRLFQRLGTRRNTCNFMMFVSQIFSHAVADTSNPKTWVKNKAQTLREKYWLATFCRSLQVGLWITLDRQVGKKECFLLQLTAWKAQHNCIGKRKQFLHVKGERDRESERWWSFLTIKVSWICRVLRLKGFGHVAAHEDSHPVFHRFHGESFRLPADICRLSSVSTLVQGGVD